MPRNGKRGRGQSRKSLADSGERTPFEHQRYTSHRSFSKGKEIDQSEEEFKSLHNQRKFRPSNYSQHRSFNSSGQRSSNYPNKMSSFNNNSDRNRTFETAPNEFASNFSVSRHSQISASSLDEDRSNEILYSNNNNDRYFDARFSSQNERSFQPESTYLLRRDNHDHNSSPTEETEPMSLLDEKKGFFEKVKRKKPTEFIIEYRKEIDDLSQRSITKNLENVEKMNTYQFKGAPCPIFNALVNNLHLQREEFENFVTKAKQKLSSLNSSDIYDIFRKGDIILDSVKCECKLFDKVLPGYSLKSSLLSKLKNNQVVIVSSDSLYYLNVVFPILLSKEYPSHLVLCCETNEILSSSLSINVNNLSPKDYELDSNENNVKFFTTEELLKFIMKDPKIVNRERDFISICRLPLKRTINDDILLAKLRDLLEDQQNPSKLILLLSVCDKTEKYENYFSDFEVDIIAPPSLTFPVSTIWRNSPLLPTDDYVDVVVKTILSIHFIKEEGDIMVFLPSIPDVLSASVALREKLLSLSINDLNFVQLLENKTQPDQIKWLNMCYQNQTSGRMVFLVTDCAESFVLPSVSYVIDCGLKREHLYDPNKKLDVLTTRFISYDRAKLRKKIAGAFASNAVCYRLYNKENCREEMPAVECPEILSIDPFNAMIKVFQHEPCNAADIEFVENLPTETKSRALKILKKSNAVKDNKLTPLGERIIKLPFPPLYSKLISLGIEWDLGYEVVIIVAFLSVKGRIFKFYNDTELQRKVDAAKLMLPLHRESDIISYLYIYKLWLKNSLDASWCENMYLNYDTLKLVHAKVAEICQVVEDKLKKTIDRKFQENDVTSSLLELLFECFKMNLCVFTGHYRSGYRMLSSRCISFLHPSSILCQTEELPQFIVFDHMISTTRDFLVNITSISPEVVMSALTEQSLDFDYSDMFENSLVEKIIEPVGERMIKQVLLGKKGRKLKEIEDKIKAILSDESIVIDPSIEKGRISVFASGACIDEAFKVVQGIIKEQYDIILNSEETHIIKLINGNVVIPIELKWLKGGTLKSLSIKRDDLQSQDNLLSKEQAENIPYLIKKSINITFIRRKCRGIAFVKFTPQHFTFARKFSMKTVKILGKDVFINIDEYQKNILVLSGIPADTTQTELESHLKKLLPPNIEFEKIELKYEASFETSSKDLQIIREEIEESCRKHTELVDFKVVINAPKPSATLMKAYINVSNDENILTASVDLLNNLNSVFPGLRCMPNFSTVIKSSLKVIKALEPRFEEKLTELEEMIIERFGDTNLFKFDIFPFDDQICSLKMSSSNFEILQALQRTIYSLLEGDVLDQSFNKEIGKLLCHGGLLRLNSLEEASGVHIVCDYKSKSLRLFGSKKKCSFVKQKIIQLIREIETETAKEISLATTSNNRILLKKLLVQYGVDLESFISSCELRLALLNFKACTLILYGSEDSVDKAECILKDLASSIDLDNLTEIDDGEVCPVCVCRAQNLTHRLEICGHLYCFECLHALVLQAQFPIKCCLEGCNKEIILEDISKAVDYNEEKLDALLEKSMKKYLEDYRADYVYCPAPDCSMFFKKQDISNSKHTCPLCLNDICIKCNVVYHQGYSCDMYQGSRNDPDYSFKIWQQETSECKQCPKCHTAIQKDGGCDHMTCKTCNSHFCWVCVQPFPTASAVYDHIPFCPKHPKW